MANKLVSRARKLREQSQDIPHENERNLFGRAEGFLRWLAVLRQLVGRDVLEQVPSQNVVQMWLVVTRRSGDRTEDHVHVHKMDC